MDATDTACALAGRFKGGVYGAAMRIGAGPSNLAKALAKKGTAKFGCEEANDLTVAAVQDGVPNPLAIINAMALNAGAIVVPVPSTVNDKGDTLKCLAEAAHEFGVFVAQVGDAVAGGNVTANDLRTVERELGALIGCGQACIARLEQLHEAAKPPHLKAGAGAT